MSIELAFSQLEKELTARGQGTPTQPKMGTADWYSLRALSLGLSCLRQMQLRGIASDEKLCERFYRDCLKSMKAADEETQPK